MEIFQAIQVSSFIIFGTSAVIAIICLYQFKKLHYNPLVAISLGIALIGLSTIIDAYTISLPSWNNLDQIFFFSRLNSIIATIGIGIVGFGFIQSQKNTRFFGERMAIYYYLIGVTATSHAYSPNITLEWINGAGWQYIYTSPFMILTDLFFFLPFFDLIIRGVWRLMRPFRTKESRRTLITFFVGLLFPILTNIMSYAWGTIYLYVGTAIGFCIMTISFAIDPFVITISRVRIYDLIVSIRSFTVARYNFEKNEAILHEDLFSGAFSGINSLMNEAISSKKDLTFLQTGDKAVIIAKTGLVQVYLVASGVDEVCLPAITAVGHAVNQYYANQDISLTRLMEPSDFAAMALKYITFA